MFLEIASEIAVSQLVEHRKDIRSYFSDVIRAIFSGRSRVGIVGAGGTGKTTLSLELGSDGEREAAGGAYVVSAVPEVTTIQGVRFSKVTTLPGQERRRAVHWPEFLTELAEGKVTGVINVVSYGYHSIAFESYKDHPAFRAGSDQSTFLQDYREHCLKEELAALQTLVPHAESRTQRRLWMLTLVTKQDLWWDRRAEAKRHYTQGPYNDLIERIRTSLGNGFDHDYLSVSLGPVNLKTSAEGILFANVGGYDQPLQLANLAVLAKRLRDLCGGA